ncbi:MAG: tRNA pseudouridine(38-40) synthase TruA [Thermodesulfobacteriota bacterium]
MDETIRLKLTLAYQGTHFAGWQYQPEGRGRSVQACLEQALARLAGTFVRAQGASRTDAGVHALRQVAHADIPASRAHLPWLRALNAILPHDVAVTAVERVGADFHARYSSKSKTYSYTLWHEPDFVLPQRRPFVWRVGPLDFEAMEEAAREFTGTHDFAAFQNAGSEVKDTVRAVESLTRGPGQTPFESVWTVTGPGFLKQMVRNIMGCLADAGRGKLNAASVRFLLSTKDRSLAPATAPALGLCLQNMEFGPSERREHQGGPDGDHPDGHPGEEELGGPGGPVAG